MIVLIIMFALVGLYMLTGRGGFLIAGYNFLPKEEKAKYNEKRMCQFVGLLMLLTSIFVIIMEYKLLPEYLTISIYLATTLSAVIFMNVSKVFKIRND
ncbi:DUF3784 domain-containing protein [Macrococcoides caseolyticum]|uniref:DUF3784 domain-containing protein n=1 Tax=Macrococcoides caseolyticum TaxID=69966 RepID=UPI001F29A2E7|nr:DUF3784 domain-containing protein [Macrococcus caseolyticus]MCE4956821.1 DUF3784 domain-containing protein [Macrococcus caseolyticus]